MNNIQSKDLTKILDYIDDFYNQNKFVLTDDETRAFHDLILPFYYADEMYDLILNDEIADFYFLHCSNDFYVHKVDFIHACLCKKDYVVANKILDRIVQTLEYKAINEKTPGRNKILPSEWQGDAAMIFSELSRYFSIDSPIDDVIFLDSYVDKVFLYLNISLQRRIYEKQQRISPKLAQENKYIAELLNEVSNYCSTPRPRGFGKRVKDVAMDISNSFIELQKRNRYDVLIRVLVLLKNAGSNIKPHNFKYYFNEFIEICNSYTIQLIKKKKRSLFNYWITLEPEEEYLEILAEKLEDY